MAFENSLEYHFSTIREERGITQVKAMLFEVKDGGKDVDGNQIYDRTLLKSETLNLDENTTKAQLLSRGVVELADVNSKEGLTYTSDKFICTL